MISLLYNSLSLSFDSKYIGWFQSRTHFSRTHREERMKRGKGIILALLLCAMAVVLASAAGPRASYYLNRCQRCIYKHAQSERRVYTNGGDALLNISSDYMPRKDFQCTLTGNPSFNVSLQFQLVTNFRQGVYDGNENLAQAGAIGFCDVFSAGLKTQYKEMTIN